VLPDPGLRDLVDAALGPAVYRFRGWPHGVSQVWEVDAPDGARHFLKRHTQAHKHARERRFYEEWAPRLPDVTPRLVAAFPDALLLTALPGVPMVDAALSPAEERDVYVQAGRFLRAVNDLPYRDEEPRSVGEELRARMDGWLVDAHECVAAGDLAWALERFRPEEVLHGVARVPTYGDFQPRNWMIDRSSGAPRLGVFDFEHTRGDLWLLGVVKLWDDAWISRPDLEAAFWEGYGRRLAPEEHAQLHQACLLHAIGTIVWSRRHGDADYERHGCRVLARLRDSSPGATSSTRRSRPPPARRASRSAPAPRPRAGARGRRRSV
jgi:hypothetical protein